MIARRLFWALVVTCILLLSAKQGRAQQPPDKLTCVQAFEAAQQLRKDRKLVAAREQMIQCGQEQCPAAVRTKCVEWLPELERALPSIVVAVRDKEGRDTTDVAVVIDRKVVREKLDGTPIPIDPGPHKVGVQYAREPLLEQEIVVQEGEQYRKLTFNFRRPEPQAPRAPVWYGPPPAPAPIPPNELPYEEGQPIPDGYEVDTRFRKGLIIGGAVTLGTLWLISVISGAILAESSAVAGEDAVPLYFPVAGPFAAIGTLDASGAGMAVLIIDGVVQTAGAAMFIAGLAAQEEYLRRKLPAGAHIELAPTGGPGGGGLVLRGAF